MSAPRAVQSHPLPAGRDDASLVEVLTPLVRRWRVVVACPIAFAILAAGVSLIIPPQYTALTTFTPIASPASGLPGGLAGLAGLAGQLGFSTGPAANSSPEYFADLLNSREILTSTLLTRFPNPRDRGADTLSLMDIMRVTGGSEPERLARGIRRLDSNVRTSVDKQTGVITLQVRLRWPDLAALVANQMLVQLNSFNLEKRQSQSRAQRQFAGQRLTQAEQELRAAEQAQLQFLQANRRYSESPLLSAEEGRLERRVQLKQEVYVSLTKAYEEARIAEVRDTPVLTIIDPATPPDRRSAPRRALYVVVAFIVGIIIGMGLALWADLWDRLHRERRPDYLAFQTALGDARQQVRRLLHR